jgi:hypothetical protein
MVNIKLINCFKVLNIIVIISYFNFIIKYANYICLFNDIKNL